MDCNAENCPSLIMAKENRERIVGLEQSDKGNIANFATLKVQFDHMSHDIETIMTLLKDLTDKPARRWDIVVTMLITSAVAAFVANIL